MTESQPPAVPGHTPADWNAQYVDSQVWSGNPNHLLVDEAAQLPLGRALDVGCGEGADAIWLAQQGWDVTAIDVAAAAIERGRAAAAQAPVAVTWIVTSLDDFATPAPFDLVSVFYPALWKDGPAADTLFSLVAPGGSLLFVTHAQVDREVALSHGFDPDSYLDHTALRERAQSLLDAGTWTIVSEGQHERNVTAGRGAHHHADLLLHLRRNGAA